MTLNPKESAVGGAAKLYDPSKNHAIRRPKKGDHLARLYCKTYKGLPQGVTHHLQMLDVFNDAYPALGITPNASKLYSYLYKMTHAKDWHKHRIALVWPSNETIINALNICDVSALKKLFKQLRDVGLIAYKDSPTRKRYGERLESGLINYPKSYGIVLNSIAGLYGNLKKLAHEYKVTKDYQKKIKRAVTIYRRERDDLLTAAEALVEPQAFQNALTMFTVLDEQIAESGRDYALKESILNQYRDTLDALDSLIIAAVDVSLDIEDSAKDELLSHMESYEIEKPRVGGNNHPSTITITESPLGFSNRLSDNSNRGQSGNTPSNGFGVAALAKIRKMEEEANKGKLRNTEKQHQYKPAKISYEQVKTALPYKIRKELKDDYGFFELYDVLQEDARNLMIPSHVFDEARLLMGQEITCACYAKILDMGAKLRSPLGYFKGLMDKYRNGALRIERSLFGIIKESQNPKPLCATLFD